MKTYADWKNHEADVQLREERRERQARVCPPPTDEQLAARQADIDAIRDKRRDIELRMVPLCIDRANLNGILGVHDHWKGRQAEALRALCRQLLTEVEQAIQPFSEELKQLALMEKT